MMTANGVIAIMEAVKKGAVIQRKGQSTGNKWVDCDMAALLKNGVQYRVKPKRKAK